MIRMTRDEYSMTFGEWCNKTKGTKLKLNQFGDIDFRDKGKQSAVDQYHDLWTAERKAFVLQDKNEKITNALQSLKKQGIKCVLSNYQNGHIKAETKHGIILSYYATTGTIAGYLWTNVEGLDEFIRMCKQ